MLPHAGLDSDPRLDRPGGRRAPPGMLELRASTRASPKRRDLGNAPRRSCANGAYDAAFRTLGPGMRLVFVGINSGHWSARARAPFANPRNDFWRLLHPAGFLPRLSSRGSTMSPDLGIGLTNAARRTTRGSGDLRKADFTGAADRLEEPASRRITRASSLRRQGRVAPAAFDGRFADLGLQERTIGDTGLFACCTSTSPANAAVPMGGAD